MFTFLGADNREYGPVSLDQLKAWMAEGRADANSKVRREGSMAWIRLGELPELTPAAPDAPPLVSGQVDPVLHAEAAIAQAQPLDVLGCFERSWELLKNNFWLLVGATDLACVLSYSLNLLPLPNPYLEALIQTVLGSALYSGVYWIFLKKLRGQPADIGDLFAGFSHFFVPLALASIVVSVFVFLGFLLLILPAIYLFIAYSFVQLLIMDRKIAFWPAMELSRRIITAQWWRALGLILLGLLVALMGILGFLVGVFITLPLAIGAVVIAYEDLCNPRRR